MGTAFIGKDERAKGMFIHVLQRFDRAAATTAVA